MDKKTIIIVGPSAVGKTHLANLLTQLYPLEFTQAKLYTTRQPRNVELTVNRIFVPKEEFDYLEQTGKFVVHGELAGNWYGFTNESLQPTSKHVIVDAWPALIDQLDAIRNSLFIGLLPTKSAMNLLEQRLRRRGDDEQTVQIRKDIILRDMGDLQARRATVEKKGKMFEISADDHDFQGTVMPWLLSSLGLNA